MFFKLLALGCSLLSSVVAQNSPTTSKTPCLFSCPLANDNPSGSWPLVKRAGAVGWDSYYTIFECVYSIPSSKSDLPISEWKCSYDKRTGLQSLAASNDYCPPKALPCPSSSPSSPVQSGETSREDEPQFSNIEKVEVMPWVENGRFLLYLMEHHPGFDPVG
ncbi:hypothetical protein CPC08DRAFT_90696 [Agrocybe pediades]|nr:hypothetical protein CPC08DRAFT_90696 [Agrocybe pediades]